MRDNSARSTLSAGSPTKRRYAPFPDITPYSGPYPPAYVQGASSGAMPGPIHILSKWIGALWTLAAVACVFLTAREGMNSRPLEPGVTLSQLHLPEWIGLWAAVAAPCTILYRATKPKHR